MAGKSNIEMEGNLTDLVDMESLEEDRPCAIIDGKNRPRTSYVSQVSTTKDSSETIGDYSDLNRSRESTEPAGRVNQELRRSLVGTSVNWGIHGPFVEFGA